MSKITTVTSNLKHPAMARSLARQAQKPLRWYLAFVVLTTMAEACFVATTLPL